MDLGLGVPATFAIAGLVLVIGRFLIERIEFLRRYAIPEPVVGGLLAALIVAALNAMNTRISFDTLLQPGLMLAFFATIGLSADARMLVKGGGPLVLFTICVVGMLVRSATVWCASLNSASQSSGIPNVAWVLPGASTTTGTFANFSYWQMSISLFRRDACSRLSPLRSAPA